MKLHYLFYCFAFLFLLSCHSTRALQKEHIVSDAETRQVNAQTVSRDTIRPHSGTDQLVKADVAYDSTAFQRNLYERSFTAIRSMLEGRRTASFKDAVFLVENAFANGQLDEQLYNREITELQTLAQLYAKAHAADFDYVFPDRDTILQHAGLFAAMKDTIVFDFDSLLLVHFPMTYNPVDFNGEQDWKSTFVSTLLQTGTGNCQSLAYLYNILAEKSGLESHLALAPNHLYVKRPSRKTGMYNTELTNGTFPVDAWIMTSGYVNLQTIQNSLYMQPLGDQQELALCLLDLAKGYEKTYGIGDGAFMLRCATAALTHFPGCISAKLLQEKVLGKLADQNMAVALEHQKLVAELYNSGYRNMPEEVYLNWLSGKSAANRPPENHQPFGRFESKTDRTRTATLSKGTYDEFFADDTLAAIGRSMIDTRTLAVVEVAEDKPFTVDPETAYRFFAVDPLASKYPFYSPYAFSGNRVIDCRELEGLEPADAKKGANVLVIVVLGYEGTDPYKDKTQNKNNEYASEDVSEGSSEIGLTSIETTFAQSDKVQVVTFSSAHNEEKTVADVQQTMNNFRKENPNGKVILVGHSLGADNIVNVAKNSPEIPIELIYTIDIADDIPFGWDDDNIPSNVKYHINVYQDNSVLGGEDTEIDDSNKTVGFNYEASDAGITHTNVDNMYAKKAAARIGRIINGEKPLTDSEIKTIKKSNDQ